MSRVLGCTIPLFSIRTRRSWGIGSIADMVPCAAWLRTGGIRLMQILPAYELAAGETSPYGARTAFGIDPIYVEVEELADLDAAGRSAALGREGALALEKLRRSAKVDYATARVLKEKVLAAAFERFVAHDLARETDRARAFRAFVEEAHPWEADLSLYVALREAHEQYGWATWPDAERDRAPEALENARHEHEKRILEHHYVQWIAHEQWRLARSKLREVGVELMGDLPFVVGHESADAWAHADQFRKDLSLGAPPDAFSAEGQDWNLPPYDWDAMDADDLGWIRARTRHAAELYDRFRLDHVVGYFRMYVRRPGAKKGRFVPHHEEAQKARGRRVLEAMVQEAAPARIIAEDLGAIPDFVRETLKDLGVPGYRVVPWERDYVRHVYRDPAEFPEASVASWSTHDTAPINAWWSELQDYEREGLGKVIGVAPGATEIERWRGVMRALTGSGSDLALLLAAEILGDPGRINTPGTVGEQNWTWRLPAPVEDLEKDERVRARMSELRAFAKDGGRAT